MFGTIRKHQTWLWVILVAIMIVGLVSFLSPSSRFSGSRQGGNANYGSIDGERLTRDDYADAQRESICAISFPTEPGRIETRKGRSSTRNAKTYQWLFLIKKMKENNIHVDPASAARAGDDILRNLGRGRPIPLEIFVQQVLGGAPARRTLSVISIITSASSNWCPWSPSAASW